MSSVAAWRCFHVVFIAYCFASSREKTMTLLGVPCSPRSTRRTKACPREPVPPVTRTTASSSGCFTWAPVSEVCVEHLVPGWDRDAGIGAEPARVEDAVDHRVVDRRDPDIEPETLVDHRQESVLRDRCGRHVVETRKLRIPYRHVQKDISERARRKAGEERVRESPYFLAPPCGEPFKQAGRPRQLPADDRCSDR